MNKKAMVKDAIRVYLRDVLKEEYNCVLGSSHVDKSYEDFSNCICFDMDNLLIHIKVETSMVGVPVKEQYVAVIWGYVKGTGGRSYVYNLVTVQIMVPDFGNLYDDIKKSLKEIKRLTLLRNATAIND